MISEPYPQPISKMPAAGSDAHHPLPIDTDFLPGIVWDPNKLSPGVGGWVGVKVSYNQIFNLPINTAIATGLLEEVYAAKSAALMAMASAVKASAQSKSLLAEASATVSRAASWAAAAASFARRSRKSAADADGFATQAASERSASAFFASAAAKWFYRTRREFSDDQIMLKAQVFGG